MFGLESPTHAVTDAVDDGTIPDAGRCTDASTQCLGTVLRVCSGPGAMAVDTELAGSASGAVVFSQFFWPSALQELTGVLADGTWVPMAAVHFAAVTVALLAGWMAARTTD